MCSPFVERNKYKHKLCRRHLQSITEEDFKKTFESSFK